MTERQTLGAISPCFIVSDVPGAIRFYRELLGFELRFAEPAEEPFFAIVGRDSVQLFLKAVSETVRAQPNHTRHNGRPGMHSCMWKIRIRWLRSLPREG
jgi:catechol 2,3-dioxygenase-like lactoylglutathione lyase family enzyme